MFFPTWISVFKSDNGFFETQRGLCANAGYSHVLSPFQTAEFIQLLCLERIKTSQHSYTKTIQISIPTPIDVQYLVPLRGPQATTYLNLWLST